MDNWDIGNHVKGTTFLEKKLTFPFDITDAIIEMDFKVNPIGKTSFFWSTTDDTFEKISSTEIIMKSRILDNNASRYVSDLRVKFIDGTVETYFTATLKIVQNVTEII